MNKNPYIIINCTLDTEAINKDVNELVNILKRLSVSINQEIILIIGDKVYRIVESEDK